MPIEQLNQSACFGFYFLIAFAPGDRMHMLLFLRRTLVLTVILCVNVNMMLQFISFVSQQKGRQ